MAKHKTSNILVPEYEGITSFQKGQAARLFKRAVPKENLPPQKTKCGKRNA